MSNFRRSRTPGGVFFFTVATHRRAGFLYTPPVRAILRDAMNLCRERWPFVQQAIVLLPDHLHTIWTLPSGDSEYGLRWAWIKKSFTQQWLSSGLASDKAHAVRWSRRRSVWQPKYWEHTIRDEIDLQRHLDYIHYNPVKHGYVACAKDWPWSSFHQWVRRGVYSQDWGCLQGEADKMAFLEIQSTVGE